MTIKRALKALDEIDALTWTKVNEEVVTQEVDTEEAICLLRKKLWTLLKYS